VGTKHRNVLKRYEKVKKLLGQGKWSEGKSVYCLPKIKSLKVKVKAGGGEKKEGAAEGATPGETAKTAQPAAAGKPAAGKPAAAAKAPAKPAAKGAK
jgi:small basic protein (TIGR04137 family)